MRKVVIKNPNKEGGLSPEVTKLLDVLKKEEYD